MSKHPSLIGSNEPRAPEAIEGPKMQISNKAGRDLGTWPGLTAVDAATAYARANGYPSLELAEKHHFLAMERLIFTEVPAT